MSVFTDNWVAYANGQKAPLGSLKLKALSDRLKSYKKSVAKRYRVVFPDNIQRFLPDGKLWISTKLDGELWFLVKAEGEVALCAYNGRVLQGVPVVTEAEKLLEGVDDIVIPGELFAIPPGGSSRPRVGHVALCLGDDSLAKNLGFRAFDLLDEGEEDWLYRSYNDRFERLNALLGAGKRCGVVTTVEGEKSDAVDYFNEWVSSEKFEGLVVRSEEGITYKVKPFITIDAVVIAFGEREEHGRTEVRELTVALRRDDGTFHILGTVGNGFGEGGRVVWHKKLTQMQTGSSFRMANKEGTLSRFVRPEVIVEIKCSDIVDSDSRDVPIRRMTLSHSPDEGWAPIGTLPIVSLIHPVLVREREDKVVDAGSVGLDQAFQHVPFGGRSDKATAQVLNTSTVFRREVYTKETKGKVAIRKFVAFATNKADQDPSYPHYVVHFTDFSPGRKDPLKTDLRVAPDQEMIAAYIEAWIAKNVKKGWNLASPDI